jgi:hypothetical protein
MSARGNNFQIVLASVLIACFLDISQAASGLAAYWSFNEGSGDTAHDLSGKGNTGIISGASWVTGFKGTALQFGGYDVVTVPDKGILDSPSVTVEAWVYSDSFQANYYGIVVSKEYGDMASYRMQLYDLTGTLEFVTNNTWDAEVTGSTVLANHKWHQVAGEWSNDSLKVFVDGKLDGVALRYGSLSYSTDPLLIGSSENCIAPFTGKIDEVRVFNYALPPDSILAHYNAEFVAAPSVPTLSIPTDKSLNLPTALTLGWNTSAGAASYSVQVSTTASFATALFNLSGISGLRQAVSGLPNSATCYWHVNAGNVGGTSAWCSAWSFTTMALSPPGVPVLVLPANGSATGTLAPDLAWTSATAATSYRLQASYSSAFSSAIFDLSGISGTNQVISGIPTGSRVYWHVDAANAAGISIWSNTWSFTAGPSAVLPSQVASRSTGISFSNSGITYYLRNTSNVSIILYDMRGRLATQLMNGIQGAGSYAIDYNRAKVAAGNYIVEFKSGSLIARRMLAHLD